MQLNQRICLGHCQQAVRHQRKLKGIRAACEPQWYDKSDRRGIKGKVCTPEARAEKGRGENTGKECAPEARAEKIIVAVDVKSEAEGARRQNKEEMQETVGAEGAQCPNGGSYQGQGRRI